jgi:hypothetical protein
MTETRQPPRPAPPRTHLDWFTFLHEILPGVTDPQIADAIPKALRQSGTWRQPAPREIVPDDHRRRGKARGRALARQLAEGPQEILAALNLWHGFRRVHRDPAHPPHARRLQLKLGVGGHAF